MRRSILRSALTASLLLALAACGSDEPEAIEVTTADAQEGTEAVKQAPPVVAPPPQVDSAYERAQRSLTTATSVRLDTEFAWANGKTQYLQGARSQRDFQFVLRTLPNPDAKFDGSWLFQNSRYMRQDGQEYTDQLVAPDAHTATLAAIAALPNSEDELMPERGPADSVDGIACQPRSVDLTKAVHAAQNYTELSACVDENSSEIIKITAQTRAGDKIKVAFSGFGDAVSFPQANVAVDWTQQYPRR